MSSSNIHKEKDYLKITVRQRESDIYIMCQINIIFVAMSVTVNDGLYISHQERETFLILKETDLQK